MPVYFIIVLIAFFASLGLPGFSGFIAEVLVFLGAFKSNGANGLLHEALAITATLGLALGAAYYLWTLQRMFFGKFFIKSGHESMLYDLDRREKFMLVPLAVAILVTGIFPQLLLQYINPFALEFVDFILTSAKIN
jgi:NADH-quinone oxidoreductase subunit M